MAGWACWACWASWCRRRSKWPWLGDNLVPLFRFRMVHHGNGPKRHEWSQARCREGLIHVMGLFPDLLRLLFGT